MARWAPDARERLERAALQLYAERGFEATTVAQIAERAGLTERTFFRHYADKREVLFAGSGELQELMARTAADAPASTPPLDAVAAALEAAGALIGQRREHARQRHGVIAATPELQARELIKLASLAAALTDVLHRRGVADPAAGLAAEAGVVVLRVAFDRWVTGDGEQELVEVVRESLEQLRAVTAGR